MEQRILFWLLAMVLSIFGTSAEAKDPIVLEPTSPWRLDFAAERCSLIRRFGGETGVTLQIDSYGRKDDYQVTIAGPPIKVGKRVMAEARMAFDADSEPREPIYLMQGTSGDFGAVSFNSNFSIETRLLGDEFSEFGRENKRWTIDMLRRYAEARVEFVPRIRTMTLDFELGSAISLRLGAMDRPMAAMAQCLDDLIGSWGFDVAAHDAIQQQARPKPETVKHVQKYFPPRMLATGISAMVPVRLKIDEKGEASNCVVQLAEVAEDFKLAVCERIARMFDPAIGPDGNPVASLYFTNVRYIVN
jgi:hypothetical protein